jgi:diguanylate cyclase (GGDEF)-like protein
MSSLAEDIALAIANLGLREELRRQAIRDPLTGLYNRRYMQEFLDRELSRAARRSRSVAVLMVDLDHFKLYNDTYGHGAGDQALAGVGEVLLRSVRAEDLACRYGGEEFCVILTECPLEQAVKRATEIRQRIRQCRLQRDDRARDPLTTSIGVAAFAETTDRGDLLLKFADEALYQAKRNGRDCVVAAKPASVAFESASPIVEATKKSSAAG